MSPLQASAQPWDQGALSHANMIVLVIVSLLVVAKCMFLHTHMSALMRSPKMFASYILGCREPGCGGSVGGRPLLGFHCGAIRCEPL